MNLPLVLLVTVTIGLLGGFMLNVLLEPRYELS